MLTFDGVAPRAFESDNDAAASTVNFEGSASVVDKYYAIYPSGKISTVGGKKVITTTIPTFQTATANTFAEKANVSVAYSESYPTETGALKFKNIGAVVKFKLDAANTDVRKVRLDALGSGKKLSGPVNVTFESDGTFNSEIVTASAQSCVILESDTNLDPSQTYYMAVNPGVYTGGFRFTLIRDDGTFRTITNINDKTLERNDLVDFGTLPKIETWKPSTTELFNETFDSCEGTGGHDDSYSGSIGSSTINTDESWTNTDKCGGASACLKFGSSSTNATLTSSSISLTGNGTLTFSAAGWGGSDSNKLTVSATGASVSGDTNITLENGVWNDYTVSLTGGTGSVTITFSGKRGFIDDIVVTGVAFASEPEKIVPSTTITNLSSSVVALTSGSATFDVESNVYWTIASDEDYASVSVDGSTVTVNFDNLASGSRFATITITPSEGVAVTQKITQRGTTTVTFTPGTDTGETTVTKNNVTVALTTMNNASYYQIYASQSGTFSVPSGYKIINIEFTCTASGTSKYGPGNASSTPTGYSYSDTKGTWEGNAQSVTISSTAQVRMSSLTVTYIKE